MSFPRRWESILATSKIFFKKKDRNLKFNVEFIGKYGVKYLKLYRLMVFTFGIRYIKC
jgi:hypothetical protein